MLNVSEAAYEELVKAIESNKQTPDEVLYVRLAMGIGWGGPQLRLSLEEQPLANDTIHEFKDVKLLVHQKDDAYFDRITLDYVKDLFGMGRFTLNNEGWLIVSLVINLANSQKNQ